MDGEDLLVPPAYCQYASGPCEESFDGLEVSSALFMYSSDPPQIAETIEDAIGRQRDEARGASWIGWKDLQPAGQLVFTRICKAMRASRTLVADVTTLNFNVLFEIGFALGLGLPVVPIRDETYSVDKREFDLLGLLDTLAYVDFTNSENLVERLSSTIPGSPLAPVSSRFFLESPIYVLKDHLNVGGTSQLMSTLGKSRIQFRAHDPLEVPRLSLHEARRNVAGSVGVVAHLLSPNREGWRAHNARCALICGLAMAQQKVVVMLQEEHIRQPIDYRDVVRTYEKPSQIPGLLKDVIPVVWERIQTSGRRVQALPRGLLADVDLGDVAAENEILGLDAYFVRTGAFNLAKQGRARLVVGRKGSGKTAIFYELRNPLMDTRSALVLDLMPEGHQFARLREALLKKMPGGLRDYALVAFWHFILLTELARKILMKDATYAGRDPVRAERYEVVKTLYMDLEPDFNAEFPQRLMREVDRIIERAEGVSQEELSGRLTEILFSEHLPELETGVADYLVEKDSVWVLVDNLDKGWPTHGSSSFDIAILRSLLDASRKVQQRLEEREVEYRSLVFIRSDIYEHLLREAPDKGKDTAISLDWNDPALFEEIVRRRVETSTDAEGNFHEIWSQMAESHVQAVDTFTYLVDRTLMRPRDLLQFVRRCIEVALNRSHSKIEVEDMLHAEKSYSEDILLTSAFEIEDTFPEFKDLLLAFHGASKIIRPHDLEGRLEAASVSTEDRERAVELLLRFSFLGVVNRETETEMYAFEVQPNLRKLLYPVEVGAADFIVHPAFREALEIAS